MIVNLSRNIYEYLGKARVKDWEEYSDDLKEIVD